MNDNNKSSKKNIPQRLGNPLQRRKQKIREIIIKYSVIPICIIGLAFVMYLVIPEGNDEDTDIKRFWATTLSNIEGISIFAAAILYFIEIDDRKKRKHYEAWQVIDAAHGIRSSYARNQALQDLNEDSVSLTRVNLYNMDLKGITLKYANLTEANLSATCLSNANFKQADLTGADLSNADLSNTNLSNTNLSDTNLSHTNLSNTIIDSETQLDGKWCLVWRIVNQPTEERKLSSADLSSANLSNVNLRKADLTNADLSGANLTSADLSGAYMCCVDLRGTIIDYETKLDDKWAVVWEIVNQPAERRNLSNSDLSNSNLCGAKESRKNNLPDKLTR